MNISYVGEFSGDNLTPVSVTPRSSVKSYFFNNFARNCLVILRLFLLTPDANGEKLKKKKRELTYVLI